MTEKTVNKEKRTITGFYVIKNQMRPILATHSG
jgi:hypothetical protein